jgi:hypothetical protein
MAQHQIASAQRLDRTDTPAPRGKLLAWRRRSLTRCPTRVGSIFRGPAGPVVRGRSGDKARLHGTSARGSGPTMTPPGPGGAMRSSDAAEVPPDSAPRRFRFLPSWRRGFRTVGSKPSGSTRRDTVTLRFHPLRSVIPHARKKPEPLHESFVVVSLEPSRTRCGCATPSPPQHGIQRPNSAAGSRCNTRPLQPIAAAPAFASTT